MRDRLLQSIAEKADIPAEAMSSAPKVTLTGSARVLVENHRGLLEYSGELISINGGSVCIKLRGEGLELVSMNRGELQVRGKLWAVELE